MLAVPIKKVLANEVTIKCSFSELGLIIFQFVSFLLLLSVIGFMAISADPIEVDDYKVKKR